MSEITPEKVAAAVCSTVDGWRHDLQAALSLAAEGNVLRLETIRWVDDEQGTEIVRHYRAVVVEGSETPVVWDPDALRAAIVGEVHAFAEAASNAPREAFPDHVARLRAALVALAGVPAAKEGAR
ncbi:hypothetical protein ACFOY2_04930 [Nonomuraea purpurea]|uniref:Uncharacterized protein n=1 Tax=Nonomuraea purpurea TaxID=1849276 RepID=A0ABV8FYL3_9ACTN